MLVQKNQIQELPGLPPIRRLQQPQFGNQPVQRWGRDAQGNPIRLGQ